MKFKFIEHTADIKFQAYGKSLEDVFINSALALINSITKDKIKAKQKKLIKVNGKDKQSLLYNFLEEFLYFIDMANFIAIEIKNVKIKSDYFIRNKKRVYGMELSCEVWGDDLKKYKTEGDVKAVTYNDMFIKEEIKNGKKKFTSQVVLDV